MNNIDDAVDRHTIELENLLKDIDYKKVKNRQVDGIYNIINDMIKEIKGINATMTGEKDYEKNISQEISQTEKEVTDKITKEFEFKQQLDNKELEVQIKLLQQEIDLFKSKVKEQQVIINELNEKATKASDQVKDIALKAIEGAATTRWNTEKNRDDNANKN